MKRTLRLAAAALAAVALAMLGTAVPTANAATDPLINPDAEVTLNVHKYLGDPIVATNDGSTVEGITLPPLAGVVFDAYMVYNASVSVPGAPGAPVDLTTNAGWVTAAEIAGYTPTQTDLNNGYFIISGTYYFLRPPDSATTNASGLAQLSSTAPAPDTLPGVGLYLVVENLADSTPTSGGQAVPISSLTPTAPFFVTLPMTNPDDLTKWMYTVNVYPKNQTTSADKFVKDGNLGVENQSGYTQGQNLTYVIESSIAALSDFNHDGTIDGADLGYYYVGDNLSPALTAQSVSVSLKPSGSVPPPSLTGCNGATEVGPGCDYYYWLDYDTVTAGDQVKVIFSTSGLNKLAAAEQADSGVEVETTIVAEVTDLTQLGADGVLTNMAYVIPSQGWWTGQGNDPLMPPNDTTPPDDDTTGDVPDNNDGSPSTTVTSYYGQIVVNKYDPATDDVNLSGAEFKIYLDADADGSCEDSDVSGTAIYTKTIDNTGKVPADPDYNQVVFTGLLTSTFYNGEPQDVDHGYCLVESEAADGYTLSAEPYYVVLDHTTADTTEPDLSPATFTQEVANVKANLGNALPFTGGQGIGFLSIGGALLLAAGLGYYLVSSRRHRNAE